MKILFSLTYYSPYVSGLTLCVSRIAEGLADKHSISVLTMQHDKKLPVTEKVNSVKVVRASGLFKISKGFLSIDWIIKSWIEVGKSDTVVVNLPQLEGIIPALFAKIFNKKLITIYHCDLKLPAGIVNSFIESCVSITNKCILHLSDRVVTYTEDFGKNTPALSNFIKKSIYIYPPIKKPIIDKRVQNSIRGKIGAGSSFIIGIAARLAAEKGIEYVLESIPKLESRIKNQELRMKNKKIEPMIKILIAGPMDPVGEEEYKNKILKLVDKYKGYVEFLGSIKPSEMGSFYSLLDVLVLPSVNSTESFGMVQVEAMMYGVPVVATDLPGVRVPVEKTGMGIIVSIKGPTQLAEAILNIYKNKSKFSDKKNNVDAVFSYISSIQHYEHVITFL